MFPSFSFAVGVPTAWLRCYNPRIHSHGECHAGDCLSSLLGRRHPFSLPNPSGYPLRTTQRCLGPEEMKQWDQMVAKTLESGNAALVSCPNCNTVSRRSRYSSFHECESALLLPFSILLISRSLWSMFQRKPQLLKAMWRRVSSSTPVYMSRRRQLCHAAACLSRQ